MPGATPSYPPEFKREAVHLVRSSPNKSVAQIAKELGVSDNSLRSWVKHLVVPALFLRGAKEQSAHPAHATTSA
jgi:transposase